jgi:CBS domain-containing protein
MDLEQISSRTIVRAPRSCRLREAAQLMKVHHVGALIVTEDPPEDTRVAGIVTDRDLVLKAMADGIGPEDAMVSDVMTEGLVTLAGVAGIHAAVETMRANGVRRLGVTAPDGTLLSIVSLDDVVGAMAAELAGLAGVIRIEREREIEQSIQLPLIAL